jgi:hypothetical protein
MTRTGDVICTDTRKLEDWGIAIWLRECCKAMTFLTMSRLRAFPAISGSSRQ